MDRKRILDKISNLVIQFEVKSGELLKLNNEISIKTQQQRVLEDLITGFRAKYEILNELISEE